MRHDLGVRYKSGGITNGVFLISISMYSKITSTKSPSIYKTNFSVSFTTWRPSYKSYVIAALIQADEYGHIHRSDCRDILIYAQTNSCTLATCVVSLGSLKLHTAQARDFVELILLSLGIH